MTPSLIAEWAIAIAYFSGAIIAFVVMANIFIPFVADLVEDTREWLHRS